MHVNSVENYTALYKYKIYLGTRHSRLPFLSLENYQTMTAQFDTTHAVKVCEMEWYLVRWKSLEVTYYIGTIVVYSMEAKYYIFLNSNIWSRLIELKPQYCQEISPKIIWYMSKEIMHAYMHEWINP